MNILRFVIDTLGFGVFFGQMWQNLGLWLMQIRWFLEVGDCASGRSSAPDHLYILKLRAPPVCPPHNVLTWRHTCERQGIY